MPGNQRYTVVINEELQYATVPTTWPLPEGWRQTGASGTEEECVQYVEAHWTDMRPLSLRRLVEQDTAKSRERR